MTQPIRTGPFNRFQKIHLQQAKLIAFAIGTLLLTLFVVLGRLGIRINTTPSLPVGLYISASEASQLVEFCPPEPAASMAKQRGYRGEGSCPDGAAPLMKPVVGRPGDVVEVSHTGLSVNARRIPNTAPLQSDTQGRPLKHYPFGRYSVDFGTIWVASTYNARSFDSRYFGPISESIVRAHLRPLVTF
ncbi:MAG: conjugative transfer signal peptidase TraF [Deltaproteobacteria bacterium]|nr:conjugative transfer signal peptidase TraF [Deltaproteobacteria bacterium]